MSQVVDKAERWGVLSSYEDFRGQRRTAAPDVVEAILEAMGADGDEPPSPGARVVRAGEDVALPDTKEIELENGGTVAVNGSLPPEVPAGYHHAIARGGARSKLIVSPGSCFLPPDLWTWGWAAQLYALRSGASWGIGDLADLARTGNWSRSLGAGVVLLNPLFAAGPWPEQQPSPYFPSSRRFYNPLYLRIEDVPGASELNDIERLADAGRAHNATAAIERDEIFALKMAALEGIFVARTGEDPRFAAFERERGSMLDSFATYTALAEYHDGPPSTWPTEHSHPSEPDVARFARDHPQRIRFHKWVQFLLDDQLAHAATTIDLLHDLPVGVDGDGADAWEWQDVLVSKTDIGAPPDEFNTAGQDWGLPPFDPWKLAAAGYEPFIQTLRGAFRNGAGLRIDHVMALSRLYWIPQGVAPTDGVYVRYPLRELLDIVALESHRAHAYVIGEDLGTVEPRVREEMAARKILSYKLMWFEHDPPSSFPELALAAITNHDVATVVGMWSGSDLRAQQGLDLAPDVDAADALRARAAEMLGVPEDANDAEVIKRAFEELATAPSRVVVATLEDALGVAERPNMPGTVTERSNWSMPLPKTLEEIESDDTVTALARVLDEGRKRQ